MAARAPQLARGVRDRRRPDGRAHRRRAAPRGRGPAPVRGRNMAVVRGRETRRACLGPSSTSRRTPERAETNSSTVSGFATLDGMASGAQSVDGVYPRLQSPGRGHVLQAVSRVLTGGLTRRRRPARSLIAPGWLSTPSWSRCCAQACVGTRGCGVRARDALHQHPRLVDDHPADGAASAAQPDQIAPWDRAAVGEAD